MGELDTSLKHTIRNKPVRISILVMPGCLSSSVAALCDVFGLANDLLSHHKPDDKTATRFHVTLVAARPGPIRLSSGLSISKPGRKLDRCDVLIVPAIGSCGPIEVNAVVAQLQPELNFLNEAIFAGTRTASVCSGTFLIAATGALTRQHVAVSWLFKETFENTYPKVPLEPNRSIVRSESKHLSTGGIASAYDLALELIAELCEDEMRRKIASVLVADATRVSRWPVYNSIPSKLEAADLAEQAKAWISKHAAEPITATIVAQGCHVTARTLARHLKRTFDMTATELIQQERVNLAMQMIKTTQLPFVEITIRCGLTDPTAFRKVFKTYAGATPLQYRKRFGNLNT
jgi:transcriptional regulator GlxA family with amidase domain